MKLHQVIDILDSYAPPSLAEEKDPIGLQTGSLDMEITKICVAVDPSEKTIEHAARLGADLLVTHHPLIYMPLKTLDMRDHVARRALKLHDSNCALYVMHTNFDIAGGGTNDVLCDLFGLLNTNPLLNNATQNKLKIAVYVPKENLDDLRIAMSEAGAGVIGNYTQCAFSTPGTGTFFAGDGSDPYIGKKGALEKVDEVKMEMVCGKDRLHKVLCAMIEAHPYEEVAYDIYELQNNPDIAGFGRIGELKTDMTLMDFAEVVRESLSLTHMRVAGEPGRTVRKVALLSGGGGDFFTHAHKSGADVYVTGDTKHHQMVDAQAMGMAMIDAGHYETEKPGMASLAKRIGPELSELGVGVQYID